MTHKHCTLQMYCRKTSYKNHIRWPSVSTENIMLRNRFTSYITFPAAMILTPNNKGYNAKQLTGGVVALSVECRTYDQEVVGLSLGRARGVKTLGKFFTPMCLCSPSSISWYWPKGGDAVWLGSKGRYGSCVGGR